MIGMEPRRAGIRCHDRRMDCPLYQPYSNVIEMCMFYTTTGYPESKPKCKAERREYKRMKDADA